jgi:hypothetical protein
MSDSGSYDIRIGVVVEGMLFDEGDNTIKPSPATVLWRRLQGPSGPLSVIAVGSAGADIKKLLSDAQVKFLEDLIDAKEKQRRRSGG